VCCARFSTLVRPSAYLISAKETRSPIRMTIPPTNGTSYATSGPKVWLITGSSSGLGYHLVCRALSSVTDKTKGDLVIATARSRSIHLLESLLSVPEYEGRLKLLELDVAGHPDRIKKSIDEAVAVWGRIDVLVNNAGYISVSCLVDLEIR
jgi:NAD(P)-dependent dehydrogenase (short-subunit alcohol dehydrogenase family)